MNANKILDDLSCKLDSFNPAERKKAGIFCLPEAIARNPRMYCWDSGRA